MNIVEVIADGFLVVFFGAVVLLILMASVISGASIDGSYEEINGTLE